MKKLKQWFKKEKQKDEELVRLMNQTELEKGDVRAIIIAALITILPAVLLVIAVFVIAMLWFLSLGS